MSNNSAFFLQVVEDVIANARSEFQSEGVDENVLIELQTLWEAKLVQNEVIAPPQEEGVGPAQSRDQPQFAAPDHSANRDQPTSAAVPGGILNHFVTVQQKVVEPLLGKPHQYMPAPEPWDAKTGVRIDMNLAPASELDEGDMPLPTAVTQDFFSLDRKRKYDDVAYHGAIPQQDGASDGLPSKGEACMSWSDHRRPLLEVDAKSRSRADAAIAELLEDAARQTTGHTIPQVDGVGDEEYNDTNSEEEEDYNEPTTAPEEGGAEEDAVKEEADLGDEELGAEDDDDDLASVNDEDGEAVIKNLVLAQYDKVTRTKNKWKCTLKDGVMHLNGKDYVFAKATGEFEF